MELGIDPTAVWLHIAVAAGVTVVMFASAGLPLRRAVSLDPAAALRDPCA